MKNKVILLWGAFALCVVLAIVFWNLMNNVNPEYEKVKATVVSSKTEQVVNKKTGSRTNFYKVEVQYNGQNYDLKNPHDAYSYREGKVVDVLLSNGKLYANVEGIKTSTPVATVYYIFLFGSFGMLIVASMYTSKLGKEKKEQEQAS